jgi:hypothetical protein
MRLAMMLALFADQVSPVTELTSARGLVMARTADGGVLVPLYLDWAMWTEPMARFVDVIEHNLPQDATKKRILVSGWLSPLANSRLTSQGWEILEGVEMTWLADMDEAARQPGEPDPNRVLPEIGAR